MSESYGEKKKNMIDDGHTLLGFLMVGAAEFRERIKHRRVGRIRGKCASECLGRVVSSCFIPLKKVAESGFDGEMNGG